MKKWNFVLMAFAAIFLLACGKDSSSNVADEEAKAYCEDSSNKQGYVQFSQDAYYSPVGTGVYVYDCQKSSKTVDVKLTSGVAGGSLNLTLKWQGQYYYAPFSMGLAGGQGEFLLVDSIGDIVVAEYSGSGEIQYDYSAVALTSYKGEDISLSFGAGNYAGYVDKAVVHLTDLTIQHAGPVYAYVSSGAGTGEYECLEYYTMSMPVGMEANGQVIMSTTTTCMSYGKNLKVSITKTIDRDRKIALYPVSEGNNSERIGFVEFVSGSAKDGQIQVAPAGEGQSTFVTVTYTNNFGVSKSASAVWNNQ